MSFQIQNLTVNESVEQSNINTNQKINLLPCNPVWVYNTTANTSGSFTTNYLGYKVVNIIDSNNININYWLNNLKTLLIGNSYISGGVNIYIIGVDGDSGSNYFIQGLSSIIDNGDNTYTIAGGDIVTGGSLNINTKFYMSYFTK